MPSGRYGQTPLPTAQVAVLMGVRLAEPIAYTVIFPFINQMVEELQVTDNPDRIGFYSGLVESVFAFVQFFTVYHWAKMSDKVGRRPVILFGLLGVAISGSLFGLATSFWMMIFYRCLSGALNGNVAVIKASLGDITDESNATEAFAMYGMTWTVGTIIGSAMGGSLSHPFERFPEWFDQFVIFQVHPYLLPCLVSAFITVVGLLFALVFFKESLPSIVNSPHPQTSSFSLKLFSSHHRQSSLISNISDTDTLVDPESPIYESRQALLSKSQRGAGDFSTGPHSGAVDDTGRRRTGHWGFWDLMALRQVRITSITLFLNSFVGSAWSAASLLFFFDKNNGLGMSASAIGTALAINGVWSIACQLLLLNRIRRYLGMGLAYKALSFGWIIIWVLLPLLRQVLLNTETPLEFDPLVNDGDLPRFSEARHWPTSIAVNLLLSFVTFVNMSGSILMALVNFSSPDKTAFGAINGISTAVGCMAKVIGPSLVSALYAISMDGKVLGGRLWWIFMVIFSIGNFISCLFIENDRPSSGLSSVDEDEQPPEDNWEFETRRNGVGVSLGALGGTTVVDRGKEMGSK